MAFNFYKSCTINTGKVPSSQSTFPALLPFIAGDTNLKSIANGGHARSDGFDIRPFSDSGLTSALTYQLVSYDPTTGKFEMWVNMTAVDSAVVYVGYGDNSLSSDGSSSSTWPSKYKAVHHFGDGTTIGLTDATSNARNASWGGANHSTPIFDFLGGALQVAHIDDELTFGTGVVPTVGSVSFWWYPVWAQIDAATHDMGFYANNGNIFMLEKYVDSSLYAGWYNGSEGRVIVTTANYSLNQNQWNHFVLTWDHTIPATKLYLNGAQIGSTNSTDATWNTAGTTLYSLYNLNDAVAGGDRQDELRLADAVLTADWITTEYNNQANLSTFWTKSGEFSTGGGGSVVVPQIMNSFRQRR